jgi:distribution and morphology protein 34
MAFNFNWSPLTADAEFYSRAQDLLTKALNKSPKPPIIVDDILVDELNLGTVPPDLEILEIGDLAEDRFRGIFKMCYSGDAYLTLKTRVQANPLNTYLFSKPSFTSPKPLAAASGLTIPLSITLSEIKLSAFIILVFSKQKGLTLVFRNDPLESLKVSSTFDSIQFVRDYLQKTIEQQLRNLMMDELPAIIHRLSLQLWCPDQANKGQETPQEETDEQGINPFASLPEDPVDMHGNLLDPHAISELTLHNGSEMQSHFSQKNLLRLAALTDSHRTLSLFTPGIRDVVFRAWTGHGDRSDNPTPVHAAPSLSRMNSAPGVASTTYTFSDTGSAAHGHLPSRPSLVSLASAPSGLSIGSASRSRPGRKKKTRVVNLRKSKAQTNATDSATDTASDTASADGAMSEPLMACSISDETDGESVQSEMLPTSGLRFARDRDVSIPARHSLLAAPPLSPDDIHVTEPISTTDEKPSDKKTEKFVLEIENRAGPEKPHQGSSGSDTSSVILEQAWLMKVAGEVARRSASNEKYNRGSVDVAMWQQDAPPTYEAATH